MLLILKHISIEGPGTIGQFFEKTSYDVKIIELDQGDSLPITLDHLEAVIVLGGPMNVYEEEKYAFLKEENRFLTAVFKEQIPLLGICLGSQLIAKACGAQVQKSPVGEKGWSMVRLTEAAEQDPLFEGLNNILAVFQWHEDTFEIPKNGVLLSTGRDCLNQAFKIGRNVYSLQYHIEVTEDMIESWIRKYFKVGNAQDSQEGRKMLEQYQQLKNQFHQQAEVIYRNFERIVSASKTQKAQARQ